MNVTHTNTRNVNVHWNKHCIWQCVQDTPVLLRVVLSTNRVGEIHFREYDIHFWDLFRNNFAKMLNAWFYSNRILLENFSNTILKFRYSRSTFLWFFFLITPMDFFKFFHILLFETHLLLKEMKKFWRTIFRESGLFRDSVQKRKLQVW